jgi:putative ABC transport system permease protein
VPAFQASRVDLNEVLKDGGRGTSEGGRRQRLRSSLVIAEVAIALILLVGAGLLIRSFTRLQNVNPGFNPADAYAVSLSLPEKKYGTPEQQAAFTQQALQQLSSLPGVQSVGAAHIVPFAGGDYILGFVIGGRPRPAPGDDRSTNYYAATPDYFRAMGIPLLSGRFFNERDAAGSPPVAIINESMAKRYFPNENPIGQRIHVTNGPEVFREIVGVVADVKHYAVDRETPLQTYEPFAQKPLPFFTAIVRLTPSPTDGSGSAASFDSLPAAIRAAIYRVDKDQPVASVRPLSACLADSMARQRFAMSLFAVFSGVSLLLSAIGIYGVMAYSVTQRTGEIGIRMALGAQRADVLRLVFGQGGRLIGLGLACGLVGALLLTRFMASMLFGISTYDPLTFAAIAALLAAVAALACWLPAHRATKVDPMIALRAE